MKSTPKTLVAGLLLAGFSFAAVAQAPAVPAPGAGAPMHMRGGHHGDRDPAQMQQRREQRMAQRMAAFKQKLGITPAQESAWTAWTQAMKPSAQRPQRPGLVETARMTTPERIDRMRALRTARAAEMDRRGEATKAFYAALNPQQRLAFDEATLRFGGKRGGPRGERGGYRGHHGHHGFGR